MQMKLTGRQYRELADVLLDAFPSCSQLTQMVRFRLDKNLNALAMGDDLREIVFKLIGIAEAEGWTSRLIAAARESNPGNPRLLAFSQHFGLASTDASDQTLERVIRETNSFLDVNQWRTRLGRIEGQVCRIEIALNGGMDLIYGTGFLLGSDVLITNYHVVEAVIEGTARRAAGYRPWAMFSDVVLRFDYKQLADSTTINPGTKYHLAEDWLIDYSPLSPLDLVPEPKGDEPHIDQLDYALLRVAEKPGLDPIGQNPEPDASPRGWVEVPDRVYHFQSGTPLLILQHPKGAPLKLAFDTDAIIGLNSNRTRLTYRTNTEGGSSGSPCFDVNWELVALHHAGDPEFSSIRPATYNQGIPFSTILDLLKQRGLAGILGK